MGGPRLIAAAEEAPHLPWEQRPLLPSSALIATARNGSRGEAVGGPGWRRPHILVDVGIAWPLARASAWAAHLPVPFLKPIHSCELALAGTITRLQRCEHSHHCSQAMA